MSTKRIIEDKDFHRIVIATRRGARNITMRVKPDGLYLTVPPYSKTDKVLSTLEQFRADLRERFRQVAVRPIDFSSRIEADCFRLSLSQPFEMFYGAADAFGRSDRVLSGAYRLLG